jgi:hypothetical protein
VVRPAGSEPTTPLFAGVSGQIGGAINQLLAVLVFASIKLTQSQTPHSQFEDVTVDDGRRPVPARNGAHQLRQQRT